MTDKKIQFAIAVLILFLCSSFTGGEAISISEAIHNNLISVTVQGKKTIASGESSHYGQCITMTITNLTSNDISVKLEAGRCFDSEDQSVQDMIVTKESGLKLGPKKAGTFQVYAMCGQKTNSAPSPESKFKIGKLCSGALLGLTKLINNRNYQNSTAQSAVWAFTNNASIESIQSADNEMERLLVTYVCKGKKIALPEKYRQATVSTKVSFNYTLNSDAQISIKLYTKDGVFIKELLQLTARKEGDQSDNFWITDLDVPVGKYIAQLYVNGVLDETIEVNL